MCTIFPCTRLLYVVDIYSCYSYREIIGTIGVILTLVTLGYTVFQARRQAPSVKKSLGLQRGQLEQLRVHQT